MLSRLDSMGPHQQVRMYMLMWSLIGVCIVLFFGFVMATNQVHECIDGSIVDNPDDCVQCVVDDHCTLDQQCRAGRCAAKMCMDDDDCMVIGNECIFNLCRNIGGGSQTIFEDDNIE